MNISGMFLPLYTRVHDSESGARLFASISLFHEFDFSDFGLRPLNFEVNAKSQHPAVSKASPFAIWRHKFLIY